MEYKVITETGVHIDKFNKYRFVDRINRMIKEGWEPIGGVDFSYDRYLELERISQAMVKRWV